MAARYGAAGPWCAPVLDGRIAEYECVQLDAERTPDGRRAAARWQSLWSAISVETVLICGHKWERAATGERRTARCEAATSTALSAAKAHRTTGSARTRTSLSARLGVRAEGLGASGREITASSPGPRCSGADRLSGGVTSGDARPVRVDCPRRRCACERRVSAQRHPVAPLVRTKLEDQRKGGNRMWKRALAAAAVTGVTLVSAITEFPNWGR